jgi:hypothetical protein
MWGRIVYGCDLLLLPYSGLRLRRGAGVPEGHVFKGLKVLRLVPIFSREIRFLECPHHSKENRKNTHRDRPLDRFPSLLYGAQLKLTYPLTAQTSASTHPYPNIPTSPSSLLSP